MSDKIETDRLLSLTAQIVASHVSHNKIDSLQLSPLIETVHRTLTGLGKTPAEPDRPEPAVPIKKSVFPDYIVCLEDGKKLKMLKRHLKTAYNMTPDQYKAKWALGRDYPMVAPNYARHRSSLAKKIGLGRRPAAVLPPAPPPPPPAAAKAPARRGRKPAAAE
jgi:predicted transcriptional regulator